MQQSGMTWGEIILKQRICVPKRTICALKMDGSLTVQSDGSGQGATFTLELPCTTNGDSN
jgi:hypothetical protein